MYGVDGTNETEFGYDDWVSFLITRMKPTEM